MSERLEMMLRNRSVHVTAHADGEHVVSWDAFSAPVAGDFVGFKFYTYVIDDVCWYPSGKGWLEKVQVNMTLQS